MGDLLHVSNLEEFRSLRFDAALDAEAKVGRYDNVPPVSSDEQGVFRSFMFPWQVGRQGPVRSGVA